MILALQRHWQVLASQLTRVLRLSFPSAVFGRLICPLELPLLLLLPLRRNILILKLRAAPADFQYKAVAER